MRKGYMLDKSEVSEIEIPEVNHWTTVPILNSA